MSDGYDVGYEVIEDCNELEDEAVEKREEWRQHAEDIETSFVPAGQLLDVINDCDELEAEAVKLRQAIGLMTTALPSMEMDVNDPVSMARQVVAEVERLRVENKALVLERDNADNEVTDLKMEVERLKLKCNNLEDAMALHAWTHDENGLTDALNKLETEDK